MATTEATIPCAIRGCAHDANTIDDDTGLPLCWDCWAEIDAVRSGDVVSLRATFLEGFKFGTWAGGLFKIFGR